MLKKPTVYYYAAGVGALIVAAFAFTQGQARPAEVDSAPTSHAAARNADTEPATVYSAAQFQAPAQATEPAARQSLASAYASAKNLYAFANQAKLFPEQGGLFYAYSLARSCSNNLGSLANRPPAESQDDPTTRAKRQAAEGKIYQRCDGFMADISKDPLLADFYSNIKKTSADPYFSARADAPSAIKLLGSASDPYLIESLLLAAAPLGNDKNGEPSRYFDGAWLTNTDRELLEMATTLAACRMGLACTAEDDPTLLQNCAFGGICADTREGLLKAMIAENNIAGGQEKLIQYTDKIVKALREKNFSAFVPKK
ncbi:hypothetical protein FNU76_15810 [Chitinimonas arctica]|uniref:Uncharacterized protein n=1 Tax=Chitinimonas arctica TaxID=2594795 RepID=A0A516SHS2_9NEIS|nr:hypothetical protein [Chitinimonas arctica]QDQ27697.1 hypothetical protein FNU76_15810 [Chitinimonas arctica]